MKRFSNRWKRGTEPFSFLLTLLILMMAGGASALAENASDTGLLHPIKTLDHAAYGVEMKLVDFERSAPQNQFLDSSGVFSETPVTGMLSAVIGEDGYPVNVRGESMVVLFERAVDVNGLFQEAPFLERGALEFDSTQSFASLGENGWFTVYRELGTVEIRHGNTLDHGQFLPLNDLTPGAFSEQHPTNEWDALGRELAPEDPRKGERLYAVSSRDANYYFGLQMKAHFRLPSDGKDAWGQEITAYFSGDDDLWLYVDGMLVLDLGGVHSAVPGSINFSTGAVTYRDGKGNDVSTTMYKIFRKNYEALHPEARTREVEAYLEQIFRENDKWQWVLREDAVHTMQLFYMERGAGASNLCMRFNVPLIQPEN